MKYAIVIPARLASTRLPGKVLEDIHGEPLIWRVYEGCIGSSYVDEVDVFVLTPDIEIVSAVNERGGNAILTAPAKTVIERCASVTGLHRFGNYGRMIIVQGDEPMVNPKMVDLCIEGMGMDVWSLSCLVKELGPDDDPTNPNIVKLVMDINDQIIYFSRQPIPGITPERHAGIERPPLYKQVCVMGFNKRMLARYNEWPIGVLERAEGIDQIRYIEHGIPIKGIRSEYETQAVDTYEDLEKVRELMK